MHPRHLFSAALLATLIGLTGCQTTQSDGKPLTDSQVVEKREAILKMANLGLDSLLKQNPKVADEIKKAAGYAVFNASNVNIVLVVLSSGDGVLFQPGQKPFFMSERKAGEGLGAGFQKQYQVLIFKNQDAIKQFTAAKGVGVAKVTYDALARVYALSSPSTLNGETDFSILALIKGTAT